MSTGVPVETPPPVTSAPAGATATLVGGIVTYLIPLVTIIGMIVLMALHDIDQSTGIGIVGALAGLHAGGSIASNR